MRRSGPTGYVDPGTLCQLLAKHQPGEVFRLLESLLDFLKMPGGVKQWLPPLQQISLRHAGVERLHYHPMAEAVAVILGYQPFHNSTSSSAGDTSSSTTALVPLLAKAQGAARKATMAMFSIHVSKEQSSRVPSRWRPKCSGTAFSQETGEDVWVYAVQCQDWPPPVMRGDELTAGMSGTLWLCRSEPTYTQLLPDPRYVRGVGHASGSIYWH